MLLYVLLTFNYSLCCLFLIQAIPHAIAMVRTADQKSPREAVEFVLQLLKVAIIVILPACASAYVYAFYISAVFVSCSTTTTVGTPTLMSFGSLR